MSAAIGAKQLKLAGSWLSGAAKLAGYSWVADTIDVALRSTDVAEALRSGQDDAVKQASPPTTRSTAHGSGPVRCANLHRKGLSPPTPCRSPGAPRERSRRRPVPWDCVRHHAVPTNRGGFRVDRNPRNSGGLVRRSRGLRTEFRLFSRILRLNSPASLSPQNSVSRTTRWRGRSRG